MQNTTSKRPGKRNARPAKTKATTKALSVRRAIEDHLEHKKIESECGGLYWDNI
jgi:hypothetical protein